MPIDPRIASDQSIAEITSIEGGGNIITSSSRGPNVVQSIEAYMSEQGRLELLQFPHDRPKYYFRIDLSNYSRDNLMSVRANLNTVSTIILPLPKSIQDAHEIDYQDVSFGALYGSLLNAGANALGGSQGVANILSAQNPLTQVAEQLNQTGAGVQGADHVAAQAGIGALLDTGIGQMAQPFLGFTPNQFVTILLRGPKYKAYTFSWHLVPRNFAEAETIRKIIQDLNNASAPGLALGGAVFSFPMISQCAMFPNYNYLFRMKPTVITAVHADYTPSGQPAFFHRPEEGQYNPPESVVLTISFLELELWLKSDFVGRDMGPYETTGGQRRDESNLALNGIEGWVNQGIEWVQSELEKMNDNIRRNSVLGNGGNTE